MIPSAQSCDHIFIASGVRYADGAYCRPGGSARRTYYGHAYFCQRCLATRVEPIAGDWDSYQTRVPGSAPASQAEYDCLVPEHDRPWGRL
jgi:hypothetical protein